MKDHHTPLTLSPKRCAVYTRKSTEEGLELAFSSLDAQREAGQAYIAAQQHEGWTCLPDRYDDGGFTGGNTDRPALQRLLADIQQKRIDIVVIYKLDRLSRSLLDFTRLMELFKQHNVALVSITQKIDTSSSMGQLMLNVLMSFAEFERAIIAERTRDKIAATRRKGRWCGGYPLLGYEVDSKGGRLLVNEDEAVQVRAIFALYLEKQSLLPVVEELQRRGWTGKRWQTRKNKERGGEPFTRTSLHRLLTNVAYLGKTKYKSEVHAGEHPAIVDAQLFQAVQTLLHQNKVSGGAEIRNEFGFILKSLIRCVSCSCAMTPTHTARKQKRYRYYVCSKATKRGRKTCPSPSIPAGEIEHFVLDRIRTIGSDPSLQDEVFALAQQQDEQELTQLEAQRRTLEKDLVRWNAQVRAHAPHCKGDAESAALGLLADLEERIRVAEQQLVKVREQTHALRCRRLDRSDVAAVLQQFGPLWESLSPNEQGRLVRLMVEKIEYDGSQGNVTLTFYPTGIRLLADELAQQQPTSREKRA